MFKVLKKSKISQARLGPEGLVANTLHLFLRPGGTARLFQGLPALFV